MRLTPNMILRIRSWWVNVITRSPTSCVTNTRVSLSTRRPRSNAGGAEQSLGPVSRQSTALLNGISL